MHLVLDFSMDMCCTYRDAIEIEMFIDSGLPSADGCIRIFKSFLSK